MAGGEQPDPAPPEGMIWHPDLEKTEFRFDIAYGEELSRNTDYEHLFCCACGVYKPKGAYSRQELRRDDTRLCLHCGTHKNHDRGNFTAPSVLANKLLAHSLEQWQRAAGGANAWARTLRERSGLVTVNDPPLPGPDSSLILACSCLDL